MSFWSFDPILAWYRFPATEEFFCLWHIFCLMICQMLSIGERSGLQAEQFSTWTLLRSHAVVIAAVCGFALSCWNTKGLPWNRRHLEGSICCSKTFIYLYINLDSSDQRTFFTLKQSILNDPWPTGHNGASGPCSHMASFLHDRALVGICRWHGGLCLPTVVSGSIPGPI